MNEVLLVQIAAVFILGGLSQWIAWRLSLPSILLLLLTGFCLGESGLDFIEPDVLLGPLLFPLVSISVAVILFEGGLSLRFSELKGQAIVVSLISAGCFITWVLAALAAYFIFSLSWELALLLGAILTVSGPTVVTPLLRHIRPTPPLGQILKWEGILIDPVGALLAVFVFEVIWEELAHHNWYFVCLVVLKTIVAGGLIGWLCAWALSFFLQRRLLPEFLNNSFTVMLVLLCFIATNSFQKEAGLLGVTVMGMVLANTKSLKVGKILEFKENLVVFLISILFILLAARITKNDWSELPVVESLLFLGLLIFVIRPISVFVSTLFSDLSIRQRLFMSFLAPRGIVAAAVASLFALELQEAGVANGNLIVSFTFLVVVGTVSFYGIFSAPIAKLLHVRLSDPQGVLIAGAGEFSRLLGRAIENSGLEVRFVDTNNENIRAARREGFAATLGNALSQQIIEGLNLDGVGNLFAMTPNHEVNALISLRYGELFHSDHVYRLPEPDDGGELTGSSSPTDGLGGEVLFQQGLTPRRLEQYLREGWKVVSERVGEQMSFSDIVERYQGGIPLLAIENGGRLRTFTANQIPQLALDTTILLLAKS